MPGSQKKKVTKVERELWLSATIQDCKVVTTQETASAKCFLKIHWQDKDFPNKIRAEKLLPDAAASRKDMKLEKLAVDLEDGGMVYGMLDAAPDSFPINIDSIFLNQISSERIGGLCWTKYDEKTGVVSVSGCPSNPYPVWLGKAEPLSLLSVPSDPAHAGADRGGRQGPRSDEPAEVPV